MIAWLWCILFCQATFGNNLPGNDLAHRVTSKIQSDPYLSVRNLEVKSDNEVVTIRGFALNLRTKRRLPELIKTIDGAKSLIDQTYLLPTRVENTQLTREIIRAVTDDSKIRFRSLNIKVSSGKVTLNGLVYSFLAKDLLESAVSSVGGVTEIFDFIRVSAFPNLSDNQIKLELDAIFMTDPWLVSKPSNTVSVGVENGDVLISGSLESNAARDEILSKALRGNLRKIDSHLLTAQYIRKGLSDTQTKTLIRKTIRLDARISGGLVQVDFKNGVASLTGKLSDESTIQYAIDDAANTMGVQYVSSHIETPPPYKSAAIRIAHTLRRGY